MKGRKTGGRRKGSKNVDRTIEQKAASGVRKLVKEHLESAAHEVAEYVKTQVEEAILGGILPLPYMLQLMRDESQPPTFRAEMAKAAAPLVHAKMAEQKPAEPDIRYVTEIRRVIVQHRPEYSDGGSLPASAWRSEI